ncbi:hypothetical protein [Legionella sp. WA2022007384]
MKKANEKHPPVSKSITEDEPKISSIALALQQFRKETEKKEAAEEAAKVRCRVCFKEIAPKPLCSGHGGGSADGKSDSAKSDKTPEEKARLGEDNFLTKPRKVVETPEELMVEFAPESLGELSFDPKVIEALIAQGRLLVDSDRESKTLTIKLLCEPNSLTEEQRRELKKFMEAIIKDFHKFKEENHRSDDYPRITQDKEGNIIALHISMPTLNLYDAFIQRLANNLVPTSQLKAPFTKDQSCAPNPLAMEPQPTSIEEKIEMDDEKQELFNPSPFKMQPW